MATRDISNPQSRKQEQARELGAAYQMVGTTLVPLAAGLIIGIQAFDSNLPPAIWLAWAVVLLISASLYFVVRQQRSVSSAPWLLCVLTFFIGLATTPSAGILGSFQKDLPMHLVIALCAAAGGCFAMTKVVERHGLGNFSKAMRVFGVVAPLSFLLLISAAFLMHPEKGMGSAIVQSGLSLLLTLSGPLLPAAMAAVLLYVIAYQLNWRTRIRKRNALSATLNFYLYVFGIGNLAIVIGYMAYIAVIIIGGAAIIGYIMIRAGEP